MTDDDSGPTTPTGKRLADEMTKFGAVVVWDDLIAIEAEASEQERVLSDELGRTLTLHHLNGHTQFCAYVNGVCTASAALAKWRTNR